MAEKPGNPNKKTTSKEQGFEDPTAHVPLDLTREAKEGPPTRPEGMAANPDRNVGHETYGAALDEFHERTGPPPGEPHFTPAGGEDTEEAREEYGASAGLPRERTHPPGRAVTPPPEPEDY